MTDLAQAFALLSSMRANLPNDHEIDQKYVEEFHNQLAILEEPSPDEHAWVCDIRETPDAIVAELVRRAA